MGTAGSPLVIITPAPTEEDVKKNLPWGNEEAQKFFSMVNISTGLTPDDFLIVPPIFEAERFSKERVQLTKSIVERAAASSDVKGFVCISNPTFKHLFGYGKNPPSSVFSGKPVVTRETGFKPLFAFPDTERLRQPEKPVKPGRDYYFRLNLYNETVGKFERLMVDFAVFTKSIKVV